MAANAAPRGRYGFVEDIPQPLDVGPVMEEDDYDPAEDFRVDEGDGDGGWVDGNVDMFEEDEEPELDSEDEDEDEAAR